MQLTILRPADYLRYGIPEDDSFPKAPLLALGIEDEGTPLALLLAVKTDADGVTVFHLECLRSWDEALLRRLIFALEAWARSTGISHALCHLSTPIERAGGLARMLTQSGWAMGPSTVQLSLHIDQILPGHEPPPGSLQGSILPFFQIPLPARAHFLTQHRDIDLPSLGALDPRVCMGFVQEDQLWGCILTGRKGQQYTSYLWLPQDQHVSEQMLALLARLCRRRQIGTIFLKTSQKSTAERIHSLFSTAVKGIDVEIHGIWTAEQLESGKEIVR